MPTTLASDEVRELIRARNLPELVEHVHELHAHDVIELLNYLPAQDAAILFRLLEKNTAIEVFDDLDTHAQADLVSELGHAEINDAVNSLEPDEQARLLDELPARVAKRLISTISPDQRDSVMSLLGYPQGSVGRRMSPTLLRINDTDTVGQIRDRIRQAPESPEIPPVLSVFTRDRILKGTVEPTELIRHSDDVVVADIMDPEPMIAHTEDNAERAARRMLDAGLLIVPVLDRENRVVGVLPIDEAARIDKEAVTEDQARAGASEPLRRPYLLTSVGAIARSRIVWLLVLAISALLTVQVLQIFEDALSKQVTLALFIPLLIGIGGNTGSQAATTVTRALAIGDIYMHDVWKVAFKEVRAGIFLGALLAIPALGLASLAYSFDIGLVIALTLLLNCPIAATVGGVIPLVAHAAKVDPAVFSTPFISTFCDATGLLVYFTIAVAILGL